MKRPLIAGNWKMNLRRQTAIELATGLAAGLNADKVDVVVCPPYVYLQAVNQVVADSRIGLGAQDCYFQMSGAFTGEISPEMLADLDCRYVILGHSERRHIMGESDHLINQKVVAALEAGLTPIVCLGELLEQRESGRTWEVVQDQFQGSLAGFNAEQMKGVVLAYEPVWAIGTGKTATPEQAQQVHSDLREIIAERYNAAIAEGDSILYGGSVNSDNCLHLLAQPDIDGALVGGASLDCGSFLQIVAAGQISASR